MGESFSMRLDSKGSSSLATGAGAFFSFLLLLMTATYGLNKFEILLRRKDVDILSTIQDSYFDVESTFGAAQGFNFAVGLLGQREPLDEAIASWDISSFEWAPNDDGRIEVNTQIINSHICSEEELGLVEGDSKFFPIAESSLEAVAINQRGMVCLDESDIHIRSDKNSVSGRVLLVNLKRCAGKDYCKSEEEIDAFFANGRYLLLLANEIKFDSTKYSEESIVL